MPNPPRRAASLAATPALAVVLATLTWGDATDRAPLDTLVKVDSGGAALLVPSFARARDGRLHLSYAYVAATDPAVSGFRYATCAGPCDSPAAWRVGADAGGPSITVGPDRRLHAMSGPEYLTCASDCGLQSNWTRTRIGTGDGAIHGGRVLALDGAGSLHAVLSGGGRLSYATCAADCTTPGSWSVTVVDRDSLTGAQASLAVAPDGRLHVVSVRIDSASGLGDDDLRYATCAGACATAAGWTVMTLDSVGNASGAAIAADPRGRVHVSYALTPGLVPVPDGVRYATCAAACETRAAWEIVTLDSPTAKSLTTSLATGKDGRVHVAYTVFGTALTYATCPAHCARVERWTIAPPIAIGAYPSLVLTRSGRPLIAFQDPTDRSIVVAR